MRFTHDFFFQLKSSSGEKEKRYLEAQWIPKIRGIE
jgi:hypothetical protein